jgi:hypothetical protein
MLKTSIMMSLISILGFTMGKIRFQVVRNSLVIPTMCRAARNRDNAAMTAGLRASIGAESGKSQSASCHRGFLMPMAAQPSWLSHAGTMGARLRRWIALSVHAQFYFRTLTTSINLR